MRRSAAAVAIVVLAAGGCGRIGYDALDEQTVVASGSDALPFGGATMDDVAVVEGRAVLARLPTFTVQPTRLPRAVSSPAACAEGYDVAVGGGSGGSLAATDCVSDLHVYKKDGSLVTFAGELSVANQGLGLVHAAGAIHSVMGYCGASTDDERIVRRHVPGGGMPAVVGMFPDGAYFAATGVIADGAGAEMITTAGGYGSGPLRDMIQAMDPRDGAARHLTVTLPSLRCLAAGAVVGNTLYVVGGSTYVDCVPPTSSATREMTDEIVGVRVSPDRVEVVARLPEPLAAACAVTRADGTVTIFGGLHYVDDGAGGFTRRTSTAVYDFDPATGLVTTNPATLPAGRAAMGCARTTNDRTLLFGGAGDGETLTDEILLFEPYASSGTMTGSLDAGVAGARWTRMLAEVEMSAGMAVALEVRVGESPTWPDATSGWIPVESGVTFPAAVPPGRYVEWRATLTSDSETASPTVRRVELTYVNAP